MEDKNTEESVMYSEYYSHFKELIEIQQKVSEEDYRCSSKRWVFISQPEQQVGFSGFCG